MCIIILCESIKTGMEILTSYYKCTLFIFIYIRISAIMSLSRSCSFLFFFLSFLSPLILFSSEFHFFVPDCRTFSQFPVLCKHSASRLRRGLYFVKHIWRPDPRKTMTVFLYLNSLLSKPFSIFFSSTLYVHHL